MESQFSAIQRGFDNAIANWPLLLVRIAENAVLVVLIVVGVVAALLPIGLSGALLQEMLVETPQELLQVLMGTALLPALFAIVILTLILGFAVAMHSFVQAGVVGCYIEGERQATRTPNVHRSRFKTFTPEKWLAYGRRDWWPVFLIYNAIWLVWSLVVLVPLLVVTALIWLARDQPETLLVVGCAGLALVVLLMIVTGFLVHLWSTVAIVLKVAGQNTATSVRDGWRMTLRRAMPLIAIAVIAIVVSVAAAGSVGFGSFGIGLISSIPGMGLLTFPMQIGISFLQSAISIVVYAWFLAAVVSVVLS